MTPHDDVQQLREDVWTYMVQHPKCLMMELMGEFDLGYDDAVEIIKAMPAGYRAMGPKREKEGDGGE